MRKHFIALFIVCLSQLVFANAPLFHGDYECRGNELGTNEPFKITLNIEKTGETYSLKSYEGNSVYLGTGILDAANQRLSAVFINPAEAKETGLIVLHAKDMNKLDVVWTYIGKKHIATAMCKK